MPPSICELCQSGPHEGVHRALRDLGQSAVLWGNAAIMEPLLVAAYKLQDAVISRVSLERVELWLITRLPGGYPSDAAPMLADLWPEIAARVQAVRDATPPNLRPA